jgi:DNA-binding NarL/FixJ family response regulator
VAGGGPEPEIRVVRVLVGDDHPLMLDAVRERLERDDAITVVAVAGNGEDLVRLYSLHRPDVVLTDYSMPGCNGIEATRRILAVDAGARVLVLSAYDDEALVVGALDAGARGYLLKSLPGAEIVRKIHAVAAGEYGFDATAVRRLIDRFKADRARGDVVHGVMLTERELDVLRLLADGATNTEVAQQLALSAETVKSHVQRIYVKLGVSDRTTAVREAMRRGVLD